MVRRYEVIHSSVSGGYYEPGGSRNVPNSRLMLHVSFLESETATFLVFILTLRCSLLSL